MDFEHAKLASPAILIRDGCLLGRCTVKSSKSLSAFQRCWLPPSQGSESEDGRSKDV
jgi:hypothetical protein